MLTSQLFEFLPKFIKAQLQLIDLFFQSVDPFSVREFDYDSLTFG